MQLLTEFLLRLAFGLAGGMAIVSPRQVSSGYFRNHLYVTMGLSLLAALLSKSYPPAFWPAAIAAALSYAGSLSWLYEKSTAGKIDLVLVALAALAGAVNAAGTGLALEPHPVLHYAWIVTSGGVLGLTMAAMLLGHWYLNAPGMQLAPLRRLLIAAAVFVALHAVLCGIGLAMHWSAGLPLPSHLKMLLTLRWLFGIVGVVILIGMAWRTLEIPNTQSATGILYVAVIGTFVGETMSLLLSAESIYPL